MRQFFAFCIIGTANSALGLLLIFTMKLRFKTSDAAANIVGYAIGIAVSFMLNRAVTFAHSGNYLYAAVRFALVTAVAYLLNLTVVLWLIRAGVNSYTAQALGTIPYSLSSFLGAKYFVFKSLPVRKPVEVEATPSTSQYGYDK